MNFKRSVSKLFLLLLFVFTFSNANSQPNQGEIKIICQEKQDKLVLKAVAIFQEEIRKRTSRMVFVNPVKIKPIFSATVYIGIENNLKWLPQAEQEKLSLLGATGKEGFKIVVSEDAKTAVVAGNDARGVLYGVGKLLRVMEIYTEQVIFPKGYGISSTPEYPIRGHQLGYRPKTNAYDAWSVQQFDSYIRDLAIFGVNSIEIMPPRTDDDPTSVHMKIPAIEMIKHQSEICNSYGIDVWMWYPNMGSNYSSPDSIAKELKEREEVFSVLPRLDALFVPGGDPGELEPDELFNWLGIVAKTLVKYHPKAKIWVSPQVFKPSVSWYKRFYEHVNKEYPWFGGIVYGPWIRTPLPEVKKRINPGIPIRLYPDITHSLSCQYPVPDWDISWAMTLGRECINPRPTDEKYIHNFYAKLASGSISYSEGTNDDVNKFIWSQQDWNAETPVIETLREYSRFFIGPGYAESVAQAILQLEENFRGPLLSNLQVQKTLQSWQDMEKTASKTVLANARFQSGLIRAYYDAYIQNRLVNETNLELKARNILSDASSDDMDSKIELAEKTLQLSVKEPVAQQLKNRCVALADSLYRSFGAQLTVEKHHAAPGRGNFVDNIDVPLNDALWLLDQLGDIKKLNSREEKQKALEKMLHRTDPGPGGFYDNFGSPSSWRRIKARKTWKEDPGSLESPRVSFGVGLSGVDWVHEVVAKGFEGLTTPLAWMNQINTLYDTPLVMEYNNLDTSAVYTLRIAYTGRFRSSMKLEADGQMIHNYIRMGTKPMYEFELPRKITSDGTVTFTWLSGHDDTGEGERGSQVAEIWLIRNK